MARFTVELAGQTIGVESLFDSTKDYCRDYLTDRHAAFSVTVTREALRAEQLWLDAEADREGLRRRVFSEPFLERNYLQRTAARLLLPCGVLLLHGSAVALDGQGYLFTAACGTGKSTHARLWRETLGAVTVNDDKPFLRRTPDGWLLCGSPWTGKHGLGQNLTTTLKAICVLERGTENRIAPIASHPELERQLCCDDGLLTHLTQEVPLWLLQCTPTPEAARLAHAVMSR